MERKRVPSKVLRSRKYFPLKEWLWCIITLWLLSTLRFLSVMHSFPFFPPSPLQGKGREDYTDQKDAWFWAEMSKFNQSLPSWSSDFYIKHSYCWFYWVHIQHILAAQRPLIMSAWVTLEDNSEIVQFIAIFASS